ncbi:hypothetical protein [uncultured Chryseobacterium sp.]|uniref:hypothetical protein n=1 Tax=uncultured Chryseobacterium sp. TaxID=259322 RepID=UPI0025DA9600|nr:hypothetical protein [uncultured Chryseobacterium sp.]
MKFEEVPVSHYTGIPDISIPLFSIPTSSSDIQLNVQLKYHPLSAKPDDKASETGLGWSLSAGGTITRTVRGGVADGKIESTFMSSPPATKYGIYKHDFNPTYKLIFNQLANWDINEYAFYVGIGKYDTEYDLYQYNFMGYSGRFIIKKDPDGNYIAEKLDRNNVRITSTHDSGGEVQTITITDDKGNQYLFRGMESSSKDISTVKIGLLNGSGDITTNSGGGIYFTAYHLEKVKDPRNNDLLTFNYDLVSPVEYKDPDTRTTRLAKDIIYNHSNTTMNPDSQMPGATEVQTVYNRANTKLLTSISITGKGTVNFMYEKGRNDSNYLNAGDLYKLKSVQSNSIGQNTGQYIDKYSFDYEYSNSSYSDLPYASGILKKLLLKKVVRSGTDAGEYSITYNTSDHTFRKDPWGYYKDMASSTPASIAQDVISSITYPTKGKVVFDFGENIYSHKAGFSLPMESVEGEWKDLDSGFTLDGLTSFSPSVKKEFFTVLSPQKVKLHLDLGSLIYSSWRFDIYQKLNENTFSPAVHFWEMPWQSCISNSGAQCMNNNPGADGEPITEFNAEVELQPGNYYASLSGSYGLTHKPVSYNYTAQTKEHYFESYVTKQGGGLRINAIRYFDTSVATVPSKEYIYDYTDINNAQRSSGALVFPEPVFKYTESINYQYNPSLSDISIYYNCTADTTTNYNIIPSEKTQGSDVGYRHVTLKQIVRGNDNTIADKGKTVYTFRSPVDFPNPEVITPYMPVLPITNHDYLRGQVLSEKKYSADGKLLSEVNNDYVSYVVEKLEGIKGKDNFYNDIDPERYKYKYYDPFNLLYPSVSLTTPYKYFVKYGITLPTQKTEKSYFYKNGVQSSVTTTTNTVYNPEDYPVQVTQSILGGDVYSSAYKYAKEKGNQGLINANMLGIPLETESRKNNGLLSRIETRYDGPDLLLPSSVVSADVQTGAPYTEVTYERYDSAGNLLQYKTKDGVSVAIIWGYNKTQPIARVEGITYSALEQSVSAQISGAVSASDSDAGAVPGGDESALLAALDNLRTALSGISTSATTYTYDPLIGVRTITQPSGAQELYYYDSANRLREIKQKEISATNTVSYKTVKEFNYNYKN